MDHSKIAKKKTLNFSANPRSNRSWISKSAPLPMWAALKKKQQSKRSLKLGIESKRFSNSEKKSKKKWLTLKRGSRHSRAKSQGAFMTRKIWMDSWSTHQINTIAASVASTIISFSHFYMKTSCTGSQCQEGIWRARTLFKTRLTRSWRNRQSSLRKFCSIAP